MEFTKIIDFPDSVDRETAILFVAWSLASRAFERWQASNMEKSSDELLEAYSKLFEKAFNEITRISKS
jgi:uncharacterized membrane protein YccC